MRSNFVSNSTKLARAGFADAGIALDVLTAIMNAYGLEASEVNRASDVLIQIQNLLIFACTIYITNSNNLLVGTEISAGL